MKLEVWNLMHIKSGKDIESNEYNLKDSTMKNLKE